MKTAVFGGLAVKHRKSAVILELNKENVIDYRFVCPFSPTSELAQHLEKVAKEVWPSLAPKQAVSDGSDYWEYYDRELDNNGYLTMYVDKLCVERPSLDSNRIYQFNKRRIESFLYDLHKLQENNFL